MADDVDVSIAIERCAGAAAGEVAEQVLRALPEWFGLDEPLRAYVHDASTLQTLVARATRGAVGFLTFKPQTVAAAEIIVMGVLPNWHRCGIGRSLVAADSARPAGRPLRRGYQAGTRQVLRPPLRRHSRTSSRPSP
jgi:GNAT superfamily N-acetyltransferase